MGFGNFGEGALARRLQEQGVQNPARVRFQDDGIWSDIERRRAAGDEVFIAPNTNDPAGEGGYASARIYYRKPGEDWQTLTDRATHYATAPKGTGLQMAMEGLGNVTGGVVGGGLAGFLTGGPVGALAGAGIGGGTGLVNAVRGQDPTQSLYQGGLMGGLGGLAAGAGVAAGAVAPTLGTSIGSGLASGLAGYSPLPKVDQPGQGAPGMGLPPGVGTPGIGDSQKQLPGIPGFQLPQLPGGGGFDWSKILDLGGSTGDGSQPPSSPGALDKIKDWLLGKGGSTTPTTPETPGIPSNSGIPGIPSTSGIPMGGLADLAGLGLIGYGLSQGVDRLDPQDLYAGAPEKLTGMFASQQAAEEQARADAEARYKAQRAEGMTSLEQILGQGTDEAMRQAIQGRQEQLNRQGLLGGPSGALNFAVAQEAGNLRRQALPAITGFQTGTSAGLENLLMGGVQAGQSLGRTGLEQQIGLQGEQRQASLLDRLMNIEQQEEKRKSLIGLGGTALGYGLGGLPGAEAGRKAVGGLEGILGGM